MGIFAGAETLDEPKNWLNLGAGRIVQKIRIPLVQTPNLLFRSKPYKSSETVFSDDFHHLTPSRQRRYKSDDEHLIEHGNFRVPT